jgi:hypothetical protein
MEKKHNLQMRRIFIVLMLLTLLFSGHSTVFALASNETPIYLKLGKFFVLYTDPVAPFIDGNNRLLIPLNSIQDLMGGTVSFDQTTNVATITWMDHNFEFTIGSEYQKVDGNQVKMDTIPLLKEGTMYLPIRFILAPTDLDWNWKKNSHQLHISDERVVKGTPFYNFSDNDFTGIKNENAIDLLSYYMANGESYIKGRNVTGHKIPKGKADIQPLSFLAENSYIVDSYSRPIAPPMPEVKKDAQITKKVSIWLASAVYIISVGRELE